MTEEHSLMSELNLCPYNRFVLNVVITSVTIYQSWLGGSPGLVVMGRESRSEGRGFESRHWMDIFSHILTIKLYCLYENTENKRKRGRGWPIKNPIPTLPSPTPSSSLVDICKMHKR